METNNSFSTTEPSEISEMIVKVYKYKFFDKYIYVVLRNEDKSTFDIFFKSLNEGAKLDDAKLDLVKYIMNEKTGRYPGRWKHPRYQNMTTEICNEIIQNYTSIGDSLNQIEEYYLIELKIESRDDKISQIISNI